VARARHWWGPRYELRLVRVEAPATTILVRSRHRIRALAELSRWLDTDHVRLLPGCRLVVGDLRMDAPLGARVATMPIRTPAQADDRLAA
jgi:hypothetical protein